MGKEAFALLTNLQDEVTAALSAGVSTRLQQVLGPQATSTLWQELQSPNETPTDLNLGYLDGFNALDLLSLLDTSQEPSQILERVFARPRATIQKLVEADSPIEFIAAARGILSNSAQEVLRTLMPFIGKQFSILFSLLTTLKNLTSEDALQAVRQAYLKYFFTKKGFATVDGARIVAPLQLSGLDLDAPAQLKGLASERTAERYVRDLIRLSVEAANDVRYNNLPARHQAMLTHAGAHAEKFANWFRGFSSLAESTVMGAVEQVTLGVGPFQSNPLLAAAAGTFAGTVARKAAQHVFLSELEASLPR